MSAQTTVAGYLVAFIEVGTAEKALDSEKTRERLVEEEGRPGRGLVVLGTGPVV